MKRKVTVCEKSLFNSIFRVGDITLVFVAVVSVSGIIAETNAVSAMSDPHPIDMLGIGMLAALCLIVMFGISALGAVFAGVGAKLAQQTVVKKAPAFCFASLS
ncbi:MAG: hypothetical protein IJC49_06040 [Clostridia bacterium]|nr:hypothetical protein [Clostridia bacterium]